MPDISPGAMAVVDRLRAFSAGFSPDALKISENFAPKNDPYEDYIMEAEVTLRPTQPSAFDVALMCCADTTGFGVMLQHRLAAAAELKPRRQIGWHPYCIYTSPITISADQVVAMCDALASGNIKVILGVMAGRLVAIETELPLSLPLSLNRRTVGPMWLARGLRGLKFTDERPFKASPW